MSSSANHQQIHTSDDDHWHDDHWDGAADDLELEGTVFMPMLTETVSWLDDLGRDFAIGIGEIIDIGSGPGVGTCELARQFADATVVAVDGSAVLLERAERRAAALGMGDRIRTCRADLPDGAGLAGSADLIWASLVLHHVDDPAAMLDRLRRQLNPGGMIAILEPGSPLRFLPDEGPVGRRGNAEPHDHDHDRAEWTSHLGFDSRRAAMADLAGRGGLQIVAERAVSLRLEAPLSLDARRVLLGHLRRMGRFLGERLDEDDHAAHRTLVDPDSPHGVMRRGDLHLEVSRNVYVLRAAEATSGEAAAP